MLPCSLKDCNVAEIDDDFPEESKLVRESLSTSCLVELCTAAVPSNNKPRAHVTSGQIPGISSLKAKARLTLNIKGYISFFSLRLPFRVFFSCNM
jgi:hypothetical protein